VYAENMDFAKGIGAFVMEPLVLLRAFAHLGWKCEFC
jgi:hypothetical protein